MANVERIGVSLESDLLEDFDELIRTEKYANRSEAIRDLIRDKLSVAKTELPNAQGMAAVIVMYDHHASGLSQKLASLQHSKYFSTIVSMHIHVDHHNCLEIIALRGAIPEIKKMADEIIALKGVKIGKMSLVSMDSKKNKTHHKH